MKVYICVETLRLASRIQRIIKEIIITSWVHIETKDIEMELYHHYYLTSTWSDKDMSK